MQQLSDDAATRDQALLSELRNLNTLLQQQATETAERGQAQTDELRKMTRALDAEVARQDSTGGPREQ